MDKQRIRLRREVPWGLIEFEQDPPKDNGYQHRAYYATVGETRRERYPSVSTFLGVLNKKALPRWYEEQGVIAALSMERAGVLKDVTVDDATGVLRKNKLGAEATRDNAAKRGIAIHKVAERYLCDGVFPNPADYPPDHRGFIVALAKWVLSIEAKGIEVESAEQIVAHPRFKYAGRMDMRLRVGGLPVVYDFKTNRQGRVYPEHCYQPIAYALADFECGVDAPHDCRVVAFGLDGTYEDLSAPAGPAAVRAALDAYRQQQQIEQGLRAARERLEALAA